jgi:hypothetical protein
MYISLHAFPKLPCNNSSYFIISLKTDRRRDKNVNIVNERRKVIGKAVGWSSTHDVSVGGGEGALRFYEVTRHHTIVLLIGLA